MSAFKFGTGLIAATLMLAAPALKAQESEAQGGQQQYGAPATHQEAIMIDEAMIEKFAAAYGEVISIRKDFSARLQNVEDSSQAQALQEQVQAEMVEAVRAEGLTVQEYNAVAKRASQNPELRAQLETLLDNS
jgi:phage baseplate assembly protein W